MRWKVPDGECCWAERLMAAKYRCDIYHRVMVKRVLEGNMVSAFYIDFDTVDKSKRKDVSLQHTTFLKLSALAIESRQAGMKEVDGMEAHAKKRLVELASDGILVPREVDAMVMAGVRVSQDGAVETEVRLALWLNDLSDGEWFNEDFGWGAMGCDGHLQVQE